MITQENISEPNTISDDSTAEVKPKLPKSLTTVTKFSKLVALIMFVALPFIGFYFGVEYQNKKVSSKISQKNYQLEELKKEKGDLEEKIGLLSNTEEQDEVSTNINVKIHSPTGNPTVYELSIGVISKKLMESKAPWVNLFTDLENKFNRSMYTALFSYPKSEDEEYLREKYLLLDQKGEFEIESMFKTENYEFTIHEVKNELLPFIQSNTGESVKYCQVDSDCSYGRLFCAQTSNNGFMPQFGFGCTSYTPDEGFSDENIENYSHCKTWMDPNGEEYPLVKPINPVVACENNQCVTKSVDFICIE